MDGAEARRGRDREDAVTTEPVAPAPSGPSNGAGSAAGARTAVDEVLDLFERLGDGTYGEVVDQRRHALQSADLAVAAGASDCLVAAALLHDIGHLLSGPDVPGVDRTTDDDRHESVGARFVAPRFGPEAARAVALHVVAKRYRCTVDPAYLRALSPTSQATLMAQGGLLDSHEVSRFEHHPGATDALALRDWDEQAKDPTRDVAGIYTYVPVLERLARSSGPYPAAPDPGA